MGTDGPIRYKSRLLCNQMSHIGGESPSNVKGAAKPSGPATAAPSVRRITSERGPTSAGVRERSEFQRGLNPARDDRHGREVLCLQGEPQGLPEGRGLPPALEFTLRRSCVNARCASFQMVQEFSPASQTVLGGDGADSG